MLKHLIIIALGFIVQAQALEVSAGTGHLADRGIGKSAEVDALKAIIESMGGQMEKNKQDIAALREELKKLKNTPTPTPAALPSKKFTVNSVPWRQGPRRLDVSEHFTTCTVTRGPTTGESRSGTMTNKCDFTRAKDGQQWQFRAYVDKAASYMESQETGKTWLPYTCEFTCIKY